MAVYDEILMKKIEDHLETHDKRYMFIKIFYPTMLSRVNLEGSSHSCSSAIYFFFEKQQLLKQLEKDINKVFGYE